MVIRLLRIVLKIVTCAVGGTLTGAVLGEVFEPNDDNLIGVFLLTGIFCGIAWAIEHKKARRAFIAFPVAGAVLGGISVVILGDQNVLGAAIFLGLFIGTVSALATAGAYRSK